MKKRLLTSLFPSSHHYWSSKRLKQPANFNRSFLLPIAVTPIFGGVLERLTCFLRAGFAGLALLA